MRAVPVLAVMLVVFCVDVASPVIASGDSVWSVFGAQSLLQQGNLDLDEYMDVMAAKNFYWVDQVGDHYYSRFPIGPQLLSVPFVWVTDHAMQIAFAISPALEQRLIASASVPMEHVTVTTIYWRVELLIASCITAIAAAFVFMTARLRASTAKSLIVAFVFAFCTSAWSSASRSMGQHVCSMMVLSIALYLICLGKSKPRMVAYAALPLAFSYVIRPTNALPILFLTMHVLLAHRKEFVRFALWSLPVSLPFFAYNLSIYDSILPPYYSAGKQLGSNPHVIEAAMGTLISPARGLLTYTPILLYAVYGFARTVRRGEATSLDYSIALTLIAHWAALTSFGDWWGGHSFGPRYWSDLLPLMVYYLVPALDGVEGLPGKKRTSARVAFVCLLGISCFIHARGATSLAPWAWNREPTNINDTPWRLWDVRDVQFMRGW